MANRGNVSPPLLAEIKSRVSVGDFLFTTHAAGRMTARNIPVVDVEIALTGGRAEMIEDYPDDPRGPSCLILGFTAGGQP